ncbi:MAG: tetratricopeptide repeat protein [Gammaproteobacteria bacterium]
MKCIVLTAFSVLLLLAAAPAVSAADRAPELTPVQDLSYGDALFEFYRGDYFGSATKLLVAQEQQTLEHHANEAELLLGGLYLSYGQQDAAERVFESLLDTAAPEVRDRAWLYLAEIAWQRGSNERASKAIASMGDALDDEFVARRQLLESRIAIDEERFDDAVELLKRWEGGDQLAAYAQFNLGVAMVRHGDVDAGSKQLARIGKGKIRPPGTSRFRIPERWRFWSSARRDANAKQNEHQALKDKANLALGFAHLQQKEAPQASQFLQRVSSASALSSKARLGAGWAAIEQGNFTTALGHWNRLKGQDRLDPAVQEALLAIPFAHRRLGKDEQAIREYQQAIGQFEAEIDHLNGFQESLNHGEFLAALLADDTAGTVGWFWRLKSVPDSPESRYLYHLVADHAFQEGLKNYRDVLFLQENLNSWKQSLEAFRTIVDAQRSRYETQMDLQAGSSQDERLADLMGKVANARLELTRIQSESDAVALATPEEAQLWQKIERTGDRLQRISSARADSTKQKQQFLRGVMLWDLEQKYPERSWDMTKQVRELEKQVALGEKRLAKVAIAKQSSPDRFSTFDARIDAAEPRIERLLAQATRSLTQHEEYLAGLAGQQFDEHKQRLTAYLTEAQFALASAYDQAALAQESP